MKRPVRSKAIRLESERLILRQTSPKEAAVLAQFFSKNRKFHRRTDRSESFYRTPYWKEQITLERREFCQGRGLTLYLFLKRDPSVLVGEVVFDEIVRGPFQSCFLGYLLGAEYEGMGYMTEALDTAISFVFGEMNLHRISAAHMLTNTRSCRVMKRLGFKKVGVEPRYLRINGRWEDHEIHVLINNAWNPPFPRLKKTP
jgi:[ribosomal protein S5]-alanine N-acetyltransferase